MNGRRRLPPEAVDYYISLGPGRSYQAVARRFGVSKRTVSYWAREERWQDRVRKIENLVRTKRDIEAVREFEEAQARELARAADLEDAFHRMMTPKRLEGLVAAALSAAVKDGNMTAVRLLLERALGKLRSAPLSATAIDIPNGIDSAADVKEAANRILQAISLGRLAPEDAQKAAAVVEAARKVIETEDLEKRLAAVENEIRNDRRMP